MTRLETALVHGAIREGYSDKKGAVNVPIYLSSTFHQESIDEFGEYDYACLLYTSPSPRDRG